MLPETAIKVLQANNVSLKDFANINNQLFCKEEIDSLIAKYGVYDNDENVNVSIGDILGYNYKYGNNTKSNNIFETYVNFFGGDDGYHSRSDSMLDITINNPITKFEDSFMVEPMKIEEVAKGKYVISSNGLHRYTILRSLYLIECTKACSPIEVEKIKSKYTIPVSLAKLDYIKTYCKCILQGFNFVRRFSLEIDSNYKYTKRVEILDDDRNKIVFNNDELLEYTINLVKNNNYCISNLNLIASNNEGFNDFLKTYMQEALKCRRL